MPLILYRRHRKHCEVRYPEDFMSGEFDETRRGWKKCGCLIHISGTLGGEFKRKQTGKSNWDEAKAVAAQWEKAGSWQVDSVATSTPIVEPLSIEVAVSDHRADSITIKRAVEAFTSEFAEYAAPNTQKKYRLILSKLLAFSEYKGFVMLDQWGPNIKNNVLMYCPSFR